MNAATMGTATATMISGSVHGFSRIGSSFLTETPSQLRIAPHPEAKRPAAPKRRNAR
jgi:hypothetical protein